MHLIQIPATPDADGNSPLWRLWGEIAPLLEKAVAASGGITTLETELDELLSLRKQCWVVVTDNGGKQVISAAGVTSLQQHPGGLSVANIEMLGGENMKTWFSLKGEFEKWAKAEGCNEVRMFARKGWARELPDYKIRAYVMSKAIE
jgi:hypothetical protein